MCQHLPTDNPQNIKTPEERFRSFREALQDDEGLDHYKEAVAMAMKPIDDHGLLETLQHDFDRDGGSQTEIRVAVPGSDSFVRVSVDKVRIEEAMEELKARLDKELAFAVLAEHTFSWFQTKDRLKETLKWDEEATRREADDAAAAVEEVMKEYLPGDTLAEGGLPISSESIELLHKEYDAAIDKMSFWQKLAHTVASFGMYAAVYMLCGFYSLFRRRHILRDSGALLRVLALAVVTVLLCWATPRDWSETIVVALLLFSMTIVIAYDQELALLLSTVMAVVVVVSLGFGLTEFTIYVASMSTAVLCLRHIRSRTKLIYVGMVTAAITAGTAIGVGTLVDPMQEGASLLTGAAWYGFFAIMAGLLMTGLLPFIENLFGIQTELSLLELGDVAHPLLQELVRRAPGTYNHSITVASIAEAAAESIGASGLLVRVGAYFHDIGKMLKPGYFIENQGEGDNRHESLLPAMSTLVIIAHVKDGGGSGTPTQFAEFVDRLHPATSRYDVGRIFLQSCQRTARVESGRSQGGRAQLSLSRPQAADQGSGRLDDGRRRRERRPSADRPNTIAD